MTRQRRGARSGAARRGQGERGGATVAVLALVAVGLLVIAGARHLGGRVSERYRCQGDAVRALGDGAGPCQEVAAVAFAPPAAPDGDGAGGPASAGPGDPAASGGADVATPGAAGDTPPVPGTADGQGGPSPLEGCTDEAACEYQFTGEVADGEYYWPIGYDVTVTDDEVIVTIGVELVPDWDVSPDQLEDAQRIAEEGVAMYWDGRYVVTDPAGVERTVRVEIDWDHPTPHLTANLHGAPGHTNLIHWYMQGFGPTGTLQGTLGMSWEDELRITVAHELGHQLGMKDEYYEPGGAAPERDHPDDPGVHTDDTLMGDFYHEGVDETCPRQRHGETLADGLSQVTGTSFEVETIPCEEKTP